MCILNSITEHHIARTATSFIRNRFQVFYCSRIARNYLLVGILPKIQVNLRSWYDVLLRCCHDHLFALRRTGIKTAKLRSIDYTYILHMYLWKYFTANTQSTSSRSTVKRKEYKNVSLSMPFTWTDKCFDECAVYDRCKMCLYRIIECSFVYPMPNIWSNYLTTQIPFGFHISVGWQDILFP